MKTKNPNSKIPKIKNVTELSTKSNKKNKHLQQNQIKKK